MPLRRRFFYSIEGFHPPSKEETLRLGSYGFHSSLDRGLARGSLQKPLKNNSRIREVGRDIIRKYGFKISNFFEPYFFVPIEEDNETNLSYLVQAFNVPGDACEIDADWQEIRNLREEDGEYTKHWIEYSPHNVDNLQQASALLSLFTQWANTMEAILNLRHPKE